jgi:hypothetical protein
MRDTWELNVMSIDGTMYFEEHLSAEKLREKYVHSLLVCVVLLLIPPYATGTIYPHITASNHTTATHSNRGVLPLLLTFPHLPRPNPNPPPKLKLQPRTDGAATLTPTSNGAASSRLNSVRRGWYLVGRSIVYEVRFFLAF